MEPTAPHTRHAIVREYLLAEMWHSLGSYLPASRRYLYLQESLRQMEIRDARNPMQENQDPLHALLEESLTLNEQLSRNVHRAKKERSDDRINVESQQNPNVRRFRRIAVEHDAENFWFPMRRFYQLMLEASKTRPTKSTPERSLEELHAVVRVPGRWETRSQGWERFLVRLHRNQARLEPAPNQTSPEDLAKMEKGLSDDARRLLDADLSSRWFDSPTHLHVLKALSAAHGMLHGAEQERRRLLEDGSDTPNDAASEHERINQNLEACLSIFTWAYDVAQLAPWCLASTGIERERLQDLLRHRNRAFTSNDHPLSHPAIWIADQISILALYRRATTFHMLARNEQAFSDFNKVQRLARTTLRHMQIVAVDVKDSCEFLEIALALADYRIGSIYREEHAHPMALEHFASARERFDCLWANAPSSPARIHSRWLVRLLLDRGESLGKLGRITAALESYLHAWEALVRLVSARAERPPRLDESERFLDWLGSRRNEPKIPKAELQDLAVGLLRSIHSTQIPEALHALASDVLLHLGRTLGMLRLGQTPSDRAPFDSGPGDSARGPHGVAISLLQKSLEYRSSGCLARSQLLSLLPPDAGPDAADRLLAPDTLKQHVSTNDIVERAIRLYEQEILNNLRATPRTAEAHDLPAARRALLEDILWHPESPVDRYERVTRILSRPPRPSDDGLPVSKKQTSDFRIEFVSCERYSSFGPFVPRPTAFVAPGGGHFVRIHGLPVSPSTFGLDQAEAHRQTVFGIVFDPGPLFLRNLHQCGFSIGDIDMIVVTHDHPDHMASLDAVLTLLHRREKIAQGRGRRDHVKSNGRNSGGRFALDLTENGRKLPILCNRSVADRYRGIVEYPVSFIEFSEWEASRKDFIHLPRRPGDNKPANLFQMHSMPGHPDIGRNDSFALIIGDPELGPSIGFTGDVPFPSYQPGTWWDRLLETDVLVANLGGLRIPDLLEKLPGLNQLPDFIEKILATFPTEAKSPPAFDSPRQRLCDALLSGTRSDESRTMFDSMFELADCFRKHNRKRNVHRMLIVSELREEMGSARVKVATHLNGTVFRENPEPAHTTKAFTADIGMRVLIDNSGASGQCSTCALNNDYPPEHRFHSPDHLFEVCVKGEGDAVFYACKHHDPKSEAFIERFQRFNPYATHVFGRS